MKGTFRLRDVGAILNDFLQTPAVAVVINQIYVVGRLEHFLEFVDHGMGNELEVVDFVD